jgi:hypothetical protein
MIIQGAGNSSTLAGVPSTPPFLLSTTTGGDARVSAHDLEKLNVEISPNKHYFCTSKSPHSKQVSL